MKRALIPTALVVAAAGFALHAGNHCPLCGTSALAFAGDPKPDGKTAAAPEDAKNEPTLKVGDKAPGLKVDKWVKGDEVKSFESGKVYVVEFWATWCPPCRESIPHLTELQKGHKGELTVIGVAASERRQSDEDTRLTKLESFVKSQGDAMDYTVAYDGTRMMGVKWMMAAGKDTIPTAFVVGGDGTITWIGNPLNADFNASVEKALKGAKAKKAT